MLDRIAYKLRHEQTDKVIFDIYGCFMLLQRFLDLHLTLDRCGWFCSGGLESLLISHHLNRLTCSAKQGITHPFCWIRGVTPNLPGVEARIFAGTDRAGLQGIHWLCVCVRVCVCVCVCEEIPQVTGAPQIHHVFATLPTCTYKLAWRSFDYTSYDLRISSKCRHSY